MYGDWPKVEKGVPIPKSGTGGLKGFVATLQPGDSFVEVHARVAILREYARRLGFKLTARKLEPDEADGREGMARYWRVENEQKKPALRRAK